VRPITGCGVDRVRDRSAQGGGHPVRSVPDGEHGRVGPIGLLVMAWVEPGAAPGVDVDDLGVGLGLAGPGSPKAGTEAVMEGPVLGPSGPAAVRSTPIDVSVGTGPESGVVAGAGKWSVEVLTPDGRVMDEPHAATTKSAAHNAGNLDEAVVDTDTSRA
jgi:hypothetical protein